MFCATFIFQTHSSLFKMSTHRVDTLNFYLLPVINFLVEIQKENYIKQNSY